MLHSRKTLKYQRFSGFFIALPGGEKSVEIGDLGPIWAHYGEKSPFCCREYEKVKDKFERIALDEADVYRVGLCGGADEALSETDRNVIQYRCRDRRQEGAPFMTALRESAIELIKNVPEEKLYYVVQIINGVTGLYGTETSDVKAQAFDNLEQLRRKSPGLDPKAELSEYRMEKYEQ